MRSGILPTVARRALLCALTGVVLATGLLHPLWRAEWAVMDDHSMLATIGPTGELPWRAVPGVLAETEGAHPGRFSRYRPGTFGVQVIEAALFGPNPRAWFLWRTLQFAFVMAAICWALSAAVPPGVAVLLTIYTSTHAYWSDSFVHLYVSETWSSAWLAVFLIAGERCWQGVRREGGSMVAASAMAMSGALAAATKENMLILLPIAWVALWWSARRRPPRWFVWAAALFSVSLAALVVGAVLVGLHRGGDSDLYGNPVTFAKRLPLLVRPLPLALATGCGLLLLAWRVSIRAASRPDGGRVAQARLAEWRALWRSTIAIAAASATIVFSQFVFYNGQWPTGGARFDFPGRLLEIVGYATAWRFAMRALEIWGRSAMLRRAVAATCVLLLCALIVRHPVPLLRAAQRQAALTHRIGDARRTVAAAAKSVPDRPLVMVASLPVEYEPAISLGRELRVLDHVTNPLYLDVRTVKPDPTRPIDATWTAQIRDLSAHGGGSSSRRLAAPVSPWNELVARRARGGPAALCIALREYEPVSLVDCPIGVP